MINTDKNLWALWWILTIFVLVNTTMFLISSHSKQVELTLNEGEEININIFRISQDNISMKMRFSRNNGMRRSELGEWQTIGDWRESGIIEFINPGEPIKLLVSNSKQKIIYEALPVGSRSTNSSTRSLTLFENDNSPHKFSWGTRKGPLFTLSSGFNKFNVTVLKVGESLKGEKVKFYISPPISFKFTRDNSLYKYLWFFVFWPIYLFLLFIFYLILMYRRWRRQKAQSNL